MAATFAYLLDRISRAEFSTDPFPHLEILDFLNRDHFATIVASPQIAMIGCDTTRQLLAKLVEHDFEFIQFPGCVETVNEYLNWFDGKTHSNSHKATEGAGIVYRLKQSRCALLEELSDFFKSEAMQQALVAKFRIERDVTIDAGVQKYLHGYEISPHPDIRRKALTWMLNLNPGVDTESADFHTHYLKLKPQWKFVRKRLSNPTPTAALTFAG